MDSPGMRSYSLDDLLPEDLIHYFPDLLVLASQCRFHNCQHTEQSAGCAFFDHEKLSEQNPKFIQMRLKSYFQILNDLQKLPVTY